MGTALRRSRRRGSPVRPGDANIADPELAAGRLDLGLDPEAWRSRSGVSTSAGGPSATSVPAGQHPQPVGEAGGAVEVVERRDDGLAGSGERARGGRAGRAGGGRRGGPSARRAAGAARPGRAPGRARRAAARRRRAGSRGGRPTRPRSTAASAASTRSRSSAPQPLGPPEVGRPAQGDDLGRREVDGQLGLLADQRDLSCPGPRRPLADRAAPQVQAAAVGDQPGDGPEQRRLAGPVGPDERDPLARPDAERRGRARTGRPPSDTPRASADEDVGHGGRGERVEGGRHGPPMLRPLASSCSSSPSPGATARPSTRAARCSRTRPCSRPSRASPRPTTGAPS